MLTFPSTMVGCLIGLPGEWSKKGQAFNRYVQKENDDAWKYGGRTAFGKSKPPKGKADLGQLGLFD